MNQININLQNRTLLSIHLEFIVFNGNRAGVFSFHFMQLEAANNEQWHFRTIRRTINLIWLPNEMQSADVFIRNFMLVVAIFFSSCIFLTIVSKFIIWSALVQKKYFYGFKQSATIMKSTGHWTDYKFWFCVWIFGAYIKRKLRIA